MSDCQDHDAFTAQLVAVQRRLYAYILTALPNLQDADDVLQETNATLLRSRESFASGTEFAPGPAEWPISRSWLTASDNNESEAASFLPTKTSCKTWSARPVGNGQAVKS